eukprot:TRINITY_DN47000_c0_g1_i1.p1 TRINITY_DN47000_c0_g1~~TRINITY_DN47000_c0_g1_i1.p1  ORF type:complete len:381 (+),score=99.69 TRINITY_DN47000_c0_g1_i1:98-1144(+)
MMQHGSARLRSSSAPAVLRGKSAEGTDDTECAASSAHTAPSTPLSSPRNAQCTGDAFNAPGSDDGSVTWYAASPLAVPSAPLMLQREQAHAGAEFPGYRPQPIQPLPGEPESLGSASGGYCTCCADAVRCGDYGDVGGCVDWHSAFASADSELVVSDYGCGGGGGEWERSEGSARSVHPLYNAASDWSYWRYADDWQRDGPGTPADYGWASSPATHPGTPQAPGFGAGSRAGASPPPGSDEVTVEAMWVGARPPPPIYRPEGGNQRQRNPRRRAAKGDFRPGHPGRRTPRGDSVSPRGGYQGGSSPWRSPFATGGGTATTRASWHRVTEEHAVIVPVQPHGQRLPAAA